MPLSPHARVQLKLALMGAFPQYSELQMLIAEHEWVGNTYTLPSIAPETLGLEIVCFKVVEWAEKLSLVEVLVENALQVRPDHPILCEFVKKRTGKSNPAVRLMNLDILRKAVESFNRGFNERNDLFKYLNAYKELHDILHELLSFFPTIRVAVEEHIEDSSQPLSQEVADFLEEHIKSATDSVNETEFPQDHQLWVKKLENAFKVFSGSVVGKLDRELEVVELIPYSYLRELNNELIKNARRLKIRHLTMSLNEIMKALETGENATTSNLYCDVKEFRDLCLQLDELIMAHDLCQKIDNAFHEKKGNVSTPQDLTDWDDAKQRLCELTTLWKSDKRVQRTSEAAKLFEAANQYEAFIKLVETFGDLFMTTDKALLKVTNKLPRRALSLHAALETFQ